MATITEQQPRLTDHEVKLRDDIEACLRILYSNISDNDPESLPRSKMLVKIAYTLGHLHRLEGRSYDLPESARKIIADIVRDPKGGHAPWLTQ